MSCTSHCVAGALGWPWRDPREDLCPVPLWLLRSDFVLFILICRKSRFLVLAVLWVWSLSVERIIYPQSCSSVMQQLCWKNMHSSQFLDDKLSHFTAEHFVSYLVPNGAGLFVRDRVWGDDTVTVTWQRAMMSPLTRSFAVGSTWFVFSKVLQITYFSAHFTSLGLKEDKRLWDQR